MQSFYAVLTEKNSGIHHEVCLTAKFRPFLAVLVPGNKRHHVNVLLRYSGFSFKKDYFNEFSNILPRTLIFCSER